MSAAADAPRSWETRLGLRPWLTPEEIERLTPEELAALRAEAARILAQLPPSQVSTPRCDIDGELALGLLDGDHSHADDEFRDLTPAQVESQRAENARILAGLPTRAAVIPPRDVDGELAIGLLDDAEPPASAEECRRLLEDRRLS